MRVESKEGELWVVVNKLVIRELVGYWVGGWCFSVVKIRFCFFICLCLCCSLVVVVLLFYFCFGDGFCLFGVLLI